MSDFNHAINLTHDGTLIVRIPKGYQVDKVVVEEMGTENRKEYQPTRPTPSNTLGTLDCIERQAAIDAFWKLEAELRPSAIDAVLDMLKYLPSVQPGIIRCKDCKWWDKEDDMPLGYCLAIKHGFYSRNWEISIRRTYPEDFFCADAELRGEQDD